MLSRTYSWIVLVSLVLGFSLLYIFPPKIETKTVVEDRSLNKCDPQVQIKNLEKYGSIEVFRSKYGGPNQPWHVEFSSKDSTGYTFGVSAYEADFCEALKVVEARVSVFPFYKK